jgi:hypothetical protein
MYIAISTHPDIAHAVQQLCQLILGGDHPARLLGFTDSNFANCPDMQCSVSGYCFTLGSGAITWSARQQKTVSLSTCKAKYMTASEATKELVWLHTLLDELEFTQPLAMPLLCDNMGIFLRMCPIIQRLSISTLQYTHFENMWLVARSSSIM